MNETLQLIPTGEALANWCGKQVKLKGWLGGHPEVFMVAELVEVSSIGVVLSCKGRQTFFPWSSVVSVSLAEEEGGGDAALWRALIT